MGRGKTILAVLCVACCYGQTASRYTITTLAGSGSRGYSGDAGNAEAAELAVPTGVAVNAAGTVFIADAANNRIRQVTEAGVITTFAGTGNTGYAGDGAQASSAQLANPTGVAVDASGNVYIADTNNHVIRRVTSAGVISTVAGAQSKGPGFSGDGDSATSAQLNSPVAVAVDGAGNIFVAEVGNHRIRKITTDGKISTLAGNGGGGYSGDGGAATRASLNVPSGVAVDSSGNVYIGEYFNHRVRRVAPDGIITTVAGTGARGYSGDLGPATSAGLNSPRGVAVDPAGNLCIADYGNSRIRRVSGNGTIVTIAGNGRYSRSGDGGLASDAALFFPMAMVARTDGTIYIADTDNNVIRKLSPLADFTLPPRISGVIGAGAFGASNSVAPNSWIEIYGADLAITARSWRGSDFASRVAPTILDGTTVTIGGQAAVVSYISGGQVNALVPASLGAGEQTVTVTSITGTSTSWTLQVDPASPKFYSPPALNVGGRSYVGALFSNGTTYAAPAGIAAEVVSRPAHPGETITLYGLGFGPVAPNVPYGWIAQTSAITGSLQIQFGDSPATVSYAGLAPNAVGLYQFNVVVPAVAASDAVPLNITFNGVKIAQSLFTAVE